MTWIYRQHDRSQAFRHLHEALYQLGYDAGYYRGMTLFPSNWEDPKAYAVTWFEGREPADFYMMNEDGLWADAPKVLVWDGAMIGAVYRKVGA